MPGPLTDWQISGTNLAPFTLERGTDWAPALSFENSQVELPGRPGVTLVGLPRLSPATVTLRFVTKAGSQAELEMRRSELMGLLADPFAMLRRTSGGQATEAPFRVTAVGAPSDFLPGRRFRLEATCLVPGGSFRSLTHADHAAPVGTTSLPIRGTAPVYDAVARFAGPFAGTATVTDTATGTGISWSGSLFQGQYAFVDVGRMRAHVGTATSWGAGSDVSAGVDYPPAGRLVLWGRNGAPLGSYTVPDDDRLLAGQQLTQDPTTLLWYKTETAGGSQPLPSTRTVTVRVTGAPAVIRAKEAWL